MDSDHDDPGPGNTLGVPANPSVPMTSVMTTGTSWSKPPAAGSRSSSIRASRTPTGTKRSPAATLMRWCS